MCGIFSVSGVVGAGEKVVQGLKRLEYRGYDSWGVAVFEQATKNIEVEKHVGKISGAQKLQLPESSIAIGHTRWATHGGVTLENAHPHFASDGSFVLAQNGVMQNYEVVKQELMAKGYAFISETDTEVIVHLIEDCRKTASSLQEAMEKAFFMLEGRNTIILLTREGQIYAARNGSPLVIGLNQEKNIVYLSSDTLSFADEVSEVVVVENNQFVKVLPGQETALERITIWAGQSGEVIPVKPEPLKLVSTAIDKEGYPHFMIKEINENPRVVKRVVELSRENTAQFMMAAQEIAAAKHVFTIGSGTAGIAAAQTAFYLRQYGGVQAVSLVGADAMEYFPLLSEGDVMIAPSQSGETADVLEVLEIAKQKGVKIITYVNMPGSSMTRIAEHSFLAEAGPEICVMSTKVFVSQLAWGYLIAKTVQGKYEEGAQNLEQLANTMKGYLESKESESTILQLVEATKGYDDLFLMAKAQNFQVIREGMVKIIEGSYKHAHALPAGDLKHYAITLMEENVPVMVVFSNDAALADSLTAAEQVKARGAHVIGVGPTQHHVFDTFVPVPDTGETSGMMNVVPLQLYAYHLTVKLGHDVDHPRNIAKSVTVK